jgi:hypothetical protein
MAVEQRPGKTRWLTRAAGMRAPGPRRPGRAYTYLSFTICGVSARGVPAPRNRIHTSAQAA